MRFPSLELDCRAITPLQVNGADGTPQLRAASFRGVLRYWLRAALGGIHQADISALKKAESDYWGSQDAGSPLRLSVRSYKGRPVQDTISYKEKAPLFYAGRASGFQYYPIGKRLALTLDTHPLRPMHQVFNAGLYAGLLLAFRLGGFGKRARRGSGALVVEDLRLDDDIPISTDLVPLLTIVPVNADEMIAIFSGMLQYIFDLAKTTAPTQPFDDEIAAYPAVTSRHFRLYIGTRGEADYLAAINRMWTLTGPFHDRGQWAWGYARGGRRASALHMRVWQDQAGAYYPQVAFLWGGRSNERWDELEDVAAVFDHAPDFVRVYP